MGKKIKIEEFMKKYGELNSTEERKSFLESYIVKKYSPILEKKMCLQTLIDKCTIKASPEYFESFIYRVNYSAIPFILYTDIDVLSDLQSKDTVFRIYDFTKTTDFNTILSMIIYPVELDELKIISDELIKIAESKRSVFSDVTKIIDVIIDSIPENFTETFLINKGQDKNEE